jgi:hypothetical protein
VTDQQLSAAQYRFPDNTPRSKEAYFYRAAFEEHFPQRAAVETVPGEWQQQVQQQHVLAERCNGWNALQQSLHQPAVQCIVWFTTGICVRFLAGHSSLGSAMPCTRCISP